MGYSEKRLALPLSPEERPEHSDLSTKKLTKLLKTLTFLAFIGLVYYGTSDYDGKAHRDTSAPHVHRKLSTEEKENLFLSVPDPQSAVVASRLYTNHPHLAGSKEDFADARNILKVFQTELGINAPKMEPVFTAGSEESRNATLNLSSRTLFTEPTAWIDKYFPVMNTPLDRSLEILEDGEPVWSADLVEDGLPLDEDAHKYRDAVPTWHGLSREGSATGQLVYVNYGSYEDYQSLVDSGVNFTGKIVIARYGGLFRGLKVKRAAELGAVGTLIYSDPRDDGIVTVENGYLPYPEGPARNPTSVQRGSVQYLSIYPGDPTTPGYPAYENATRVDGTNIPTIPSLPISWANAQRLLSEIDEIYTSDVDENGIRKLSGKSSDRTVKLVNHVDNKVIPIWNTMAAIPGHMREEVVMLGCHRDAWVLGAADPVSGTVSLREIVRGLGVLLQNGWKPLRTILIASWDAEEAGLIGSTEYGEDFPEWLQQHVVTYLNVDVSVSGSRWGASASPTLAHLIKKTALDVPHPTDDGRTLWDARDDVGPFAGLRDNPVIDAEYAANYKEVLRDRDQPSEVSPLGSGSDYSTFLQHLGIASADQGFGPTASDAPYHYHSIYDSQRWQEIYADEGFVRHVAVAKHLGLLALRCIDSIILPLNTTEYANSLETYMERVERIAADSDVETPDFVELKKAIGEVKTASLALDEEKVEAEENFKKLLDKLPRNSIRKCRGRHHAYRKLAKFIRVIYGVQHLHERHRTGPREWEEFLSPSVADEYLSTSLGSPLEKFIEAAKRVARVNKKLSAFEQGFISSEGIKDREWYKHLVVAPGKWLGYGASTFPALSESFTFESNGTLAKVETDRLADLLIKLSQQTRP